MDEEDLAAAAESRQLETAQGFAAVGGSGDSGANDGFFGLFVTQQDTMGVKIIQKMGWRRDQGIGRKIRRSVRVDDTNEREDTEQAASQHWFAPRDVKPMPLVKQEGRKGLGFQSEARLSAQDEEKEADTGPSLHFLEKPAKPLKPRPLKKSSMGVGVLNDTGSDDEDPYELGPKIKLNRTIGTEKKAKKPSKFAKPGAGDKIVYMPKKTSSNTSSTLVLVSQDGRKPLRGFTFATVTIQPSKPRFPPPKIPEGWKSKKGSASQTPASGFQSVANAAKSSTLDVKARADLLGEKMLPGKSVFDFMSKESRERLVALTGRTDLPQAQGQAVPDMPKEEDRRSLWSFVPQLDKDLAAAALAKGASGWMPYAEDPSKRARYVAFLEIRSGTRDSLPERPPGMPFLDWTKEMQEFAHAAQVFRPASGIMASRFTSASSSTQPASGDSSKGGDLLRTHTTQPADPAEQAAKLGMYGPMTRSQFEFHPSRLLCKRFNVPPPAHIPSSADADADDPISRTREPVSNPDLEKMKHEYLTRGSNMQRPSWMYQTPDIADPSPAAPAPVAEHATVDVEVNEALAQERAPEDVFKSIFGDDDDDE